MAQTEDKTSLTPKPATSPSTSTSTSGSALKRTSLLESLIDLSISTMGFLKIGRKSVVTKRDSRVQEMAKEESSSSSSSSSAAAAAAAAAASSPPITSSQSLEEDTQSPRTPTMAPTSPSSFTPGASSFECLPIELIQRIFLHSSNPNLPLVSHTLLSTLSSPYLLKQFLVLTVLAPTTTEAYREAMSAILTRRFFTLPFLQEIESILWTQKFTLLFPTPEAQSSNLPPSIPPPQDTGRTNRQPAQTEWWFRKVCSITGEDTHLDGLTQRMISSKLDLRTISFPRNRLQPPYTPQNFETLLAIMHRAPFAFAGVSSGREGKIYCERLLEIAIRWRSAAMVYLLINYFYVQPTDAQMRMCLLPPDGTGQAKGGIEYLAPEFTGVERVDAETDYECLAVVTRDNQVAGVQTSQNVKGRWEMFRDRMDGWKRGEDNRSTVAGDLVNAKWGRDGWSRDVEDGLRVLWVFNNFLLAGTDSWRDTEGIVRRGGLMGKQSRSYPREMRGEGIVGDSVVWEANLVAKGAVLEWLMNVGTPPAGLLERFGRSWK